MEPGEFPKPVGERPEGLIEQPREDLPLAAAPERDLAGNYYLHEFLRASTLIQSHIELHNDPKIIRYAAHAALDRVLDELEPTWIENHNQALGQI